jgi:hypothetical protein
MVGEFARSQNNKRHKNKTIKNPYASSGLSSRNSSVCVVRQRRTSAAPDGSLRERLYVMLAAMSGTILRTMITLKMGVISQSIRTKRNDPHKFQCRLFIPNFKTAK